MDSLSRIGSTIGTPLFADECTTNQTRISYARMLVEIDATKPIIKQIKVQDAEGSIVEQQVVYEWIPSYCKKCQQVGHECCEENPEGHKHSRKEAAQKWVPKKANVTATDTWEQQNVPGKQAELAKGPPVVISNTFEVLNSKENLMVDKGKTPMGGDLIPFGSL